MILQASNLPFGDATTAPDLIGGRFLRATCRVFGVTEDELRSTGRGDLSEARWALSHVLSDQCGWSCLRIARLLNKDHTAILYGVRRAQALCRSSAHFLEAVQLIGEAE